MNVIPWRGVGTGVRGRGVEVGTWEVGSWTWEGLVASEVVVRGKRGG